VYLHDSTDIPTMCQVLLRPPAVGLGTHGDIRDSKAFGAPITLLRKALGPNTSSASSPNLDQISNICFLNPR
jgi:hypothetical protein